MLKVRIQGTKSEIENFLRKNKNFQGGYKAENVSRPFANQGTNKYFRVYMEVSRNDR